MSELLETLDTKDIKEEDDDTILKPKKVKQICSQKKLDALKNNRIKAEEAKTKIKEEKQLKHAKEIIEKSKDKEIPVVSKQLALASQPPPDSDTESEEELVVIKKKQKVIKEVKKKKKKVITIEISDSEDESDEEVVEFKPIPKQNPLRSREMITLQNKRSLIKVHKPEPPINYFCDN